MDQLHFTESDLESARRVYRRIGMLPRFRGGPMLVGALQASLGLFAPLADLRLRMRGFRVEHHTARVSDRVARVRVIHPPGASSGVLFDIHGGAWVMGIPAQNDAVTAALASSCNLTIVSAKYRLVRPGAVPISASVDDCESAALWTLEQFRSGPIFVSGDSAGAHLAACTLLRLRDRGKEITRITGTLLRYGVYDFAGTPSVRAGAKTLILDGPGVRRGLAELTPGLDDSERRQPSLSPLYGDLGRLPPALFLSGQDDVLRDDSTLLAERWTAAGNLAELISVPEAPHAFDRLSTDVAVKTLAYVKAWIIERMAATTPGEAQTCFAR